MVPGKSIVAIKNVSINEPFFNGHFPHHPVMPGVLIVEAMAQASALFSFTDNVLRQAIDNGHISESILNSSKVGQACTQ